MAYVNPHSAYMDKRLKEYFKDTNKWNAKITHTSHDDFISTFYSNVFTNFTLHFFTDGYVKKHPCSDCGCASQERCHGIGEDRPILIKRALEKVYPDTSKIITIREILIAFIHEHKTTKFTFKCKACHKKEPKPSKKKGITATIRVIADVPKKKFKITKA